MYVLEWVKTLPTSFMDSISWSMASNHLSRIWRENLSDVQPLVKTKSQLFPKNLSPSSPEHPDKRRERISLSGRSKRGPVSQLLASPPLSWCPWGQRWSRGTRETNATKNKQNLDRWSKMMERQFSGTSLANLSDCPEACLSAWIYFELPRWIYVLAALLTHPLWWWWHFRIWTQWVTFETLQTFDQGGVWTKWKKYKKAKTNKRV